MKYQVNITDYENGATSAIDTIEAPEGYTAENYIKDCEANAEDEWIEMLKSGTVTIEPVEE